MIRANVLIAALTLRQPCSAQRSRKRPRRPPAIPRRAAQKTRCARAATASPAGAPRFPRSTSVPKLGGQHEAYIVSALQEYKSGERSHPSMRAIAASLSDEDMANLAAYYAQSRTADGEPMMTHVRTLVASRRRSCWRCRGSRRRGADIGRGQGEGQGSLPGVPRHGRQQPDARLSEARRPVSRTTSRRRCATTSPARARTRSWRAWRRADGEGHRQPRRVLRVAAGGAVAQVLIGASQACDGRLRAPVALSACAREAVEVERARRAPCPCRCACQSTSPRHSSTACSAACSSPRAARSRSNCARMPGGWSIASCSATARCSDRCRNGLTSPLSGAIVAVDVVLRRLEHRVVFGMQRDQLRPPVCSSADSGSPRAVLAPRIDQEAARFVARGREHVRPALRARPARGVFVAVLAEIADHAFRALRRARDARCSGRAGSASDARAA